jgi:hypothetical protein
MKKRGCSIAAAGLTAWLCLSTAAWAQGSAAPAAATKGEVVVGAVEVTATVTQINPKTREVTLKLADGSETRFVADAAVKNLDQVKKGDRVAVSYTEALAYDVRKSGKPGAETSVAAVAAAPGAKPAGAVAQNTVVTVAIVAIDPKVPSITFKGPQGNTRTFKLKSADKLQGVSVGDMVDISYTEAVAMKVEKAPKK